ncbi:hypothetical protein LCGC14_0893270 [marine sediment metagenome]|uniref:DNA-directed DNA polymerase n=1 Tax=marine sediment metagenome TaxID=412755 RepID=A0A0F9P3E6_9ZZZZ
MAERQHSGRVLRRNHSNAMPRYIIAFDTETFPTPDKGKVRRFTHRFRLGVAITARIVDNKPVGICTHRINSPEQFWQLVEQFTGNRHTTWIICHNAIFDLIVSCMPEQYEKGKISIDWPRSKRKREDNNEDNVHCSGFAVLESPPTILAFRCAKTQGRFVILDTLNYFPVSLAELGVACGKQKLPMPKLLDTDAAWFAYCERDTEIVFCTFVELLQWVSKHDLGMFRYTGPSQAMSAYRHRFMRHDIYYHDNADIKKLERSSYFGGRSEVWKLGPINETVHQYDVNSLFPSVMCRGNFPCLLDRFELREDHLELFPAIDWSRSIAEVEVETNHAIYPIRTKRGVIYPIGTFKTTLAGPELVQAVNSGCVRSVGAWAEYKVAPLFDEWVQGLWGMRKQFKQDGNRLYDRFTKVMMVGLYGKFAQMSPEWVNVPNTLANLPWTSWRERDPDSGDMVPHRSFGYQTQRWTTKGEIQHTFVAISAFVTAAARVYMNRIREVIGARHCYYQGVDGLVVTNEGRQRLEDAGLVKPDELGYLRHELTTDTGQINGVSDYRLGDKVVIAGKPQLRNVTDLASGMQSRFHATSHLFSGGAVDHVVEERFDWQRQGEYWKGTRGVDGWTKPLEVKIGG